MAPAWHEAGSSPSCASGQAWGGACGATPKSKGLRYWEGNQTWRLIEKKLGTNFKSKFIGHLINPQNLSNNFKTHIFLHPCKVGKIYYYRQDGVEYGTVWLLKCCQHDTRKTLCLCMRVMLRSSGTLNNKMVPHPWYSWHSCYDC